MSGTQKTYSKAVNSKKLYDEIKEVHSDLIQVRYNDKDIEVTVIFEYAKTTLQWDQVQSVVDAHQISSLQDIKDKKNSDIDRHSQDLIYKGLDYDVNQDAQNPDIKNFSLSLVAQHNLDSVGGNFSDNVLEYMAANGVDAATAKTVIQSVVYPVRISTTDGGYHSFTDHTSLINFKNTAFGRVKSVYNEGQDLRISVNAAQTIADVEAIEDNRT